MTRTTFGVISFVLGVIAGASIYRASLVDHAEERPTASTPAPKRPLASPLVCARVVPVHESDAENEDDDADACRDDRARIAMLQGQLESCRDDRRRIRHAWSEDGPDSELPDGWMERVERSIEECDLPFELDTIDCAEYPCVAGFRLTGPGSSTIDEESVRRLDRMVDECRPLVDAFSVGEGQTDALQVHSLELPCEDGASRETALALVALDTHGAAWSAWEKRDADFEGVLRWMFRRGDDLAAAMDCEGIE